jgi:hypothetical protein
MEKSSVKLLLEKCDSLGSGVAPPATRVTIRYDSCIYTQSRAPWIYGILYSIRIVDRGTEWGVVTKKAHILDT